MLAGPGRAAAQSGEAPGALSDELPAELRAALRQIEDYRLDFDHPAVYELLEHLRTHPQPPGRLAPPLRGDALRAVIERPADFRGRAMTLAGTVGRNSSWRLRDRTSAGGGAADGADAPGGAGTAGARAAGGARAAEGGSRPVWQLELTLAGEPVAATVLLTEPADDIPIGAQVEVTGYFVMMRSYHDRRNRLRQAALLAAHSPTLVSFRAPAARDEESRLGLGIAAATLAIAVVWLLIRRQAGRRTDAEAGMRPPHPAPFSVAEDLQAWARHEQEAEPSLAPDEASRAPDEAPSAPDDRGNAGLDDRDDGRPA